MDKKKEKILVVLSQNYNINLFSENGRIHIADQIVNALDNKTMPEFGDDVITEKKAKSIKRESEKNKSLKNIDKSNVKAVKKMGTKSKQPAKRINRIKNVVKK